MKLIPVLIFTFFVLNASAQGTAVTDSGYVNVHADSRLTAMIKKINKNIPSYRSNKMRGFRVQIYSGTDRRKATEIRLSFMRSNPGIRTYLVYNTPNFRVRIGDFRTRSEAHDLYNRLYGHYNDVMIVPDLINISSTKKNDDR